jgi:hypothetical protein
VWLELTEDGVARVQGGLVDSRVADEPLDFAEPDAGRREAVALVVGRSLATRPRTSKSFPGRC